MGISVTHHAFSNQKISFLWHFFLLSVPFVQKPGAHDADCSCSEDESDYQCNSLEEMSSGNIYGVTPPTNIRGVKRDKRKHQTNIQKSSYKQFAELKKAKKLLW